ncbi:sensor domain-containing diguanylate cyclase [Orrella marina]|uniref:Diguanylate cyclase n=1 Tax=Orrella marina TaxID=2163011 RepID=A0A2R4XGG1_9BURK|nr:sensor domain-containing diguanylate cyclase [Orrella marina]AWB32809.1 hypothetical protein DBV39_02735 [Orrella marina]
MINAPFGDCLTAQLHRGNTIQSFGSMLVVEKASRKIVAASENIEAFLGESVNRLLDRSFDDVSCLHVVELPSAAEQTTSAGFEFHPVLLNNQHLYVAIHLTAHHWVLEFERIDLPALDLVWRDRQFMRSLAQLESTSSIEETATAVMQAVARVTGLDRVMLYQFLPDWHGKVLAEVLKQDVPSYLGLHFPQGDIPEIARRLYVLKRQRVIQDVDDQPVPVVALNAGLSVDLSRSELRSVHPTHIDYLKHMGVATSFSVSLVVNGKLWGLVACHHFTVQPVGFLRRQVCEQIAFVGSVRMQDQTHLVIERQRLRHLMTREQIKYELLDLGMGRQSIATQISKLRHLFDADGVWVRLNAVSHFEGNVPDDAALRLLEDWIVDNPGQAVVSFDQLPEPMRECPSLRACASGVLCVRLPADDFLVMMRSEQLLDVNWAGEPPEQDKTKPLTPRHSFDLWKSQTFGQAEPWTDIELQEAKNLLQLVEELRQGFDLKRKALTDGLTGLINRAGFDDQLKLAVQASLRSDAYCAVLMMDLDYFKPINDEFGHQAGDQALIEVGNRLKACVRDRDVVARFGGDEFAIIQFHVTDLASIEQVCERVLHVFDQPILIGDQPRHLGVSIGVAVCPFDGTIPHTLVGRADSALYQVKNSGRNNYRFASRHE